MVVQAEGKVAGPWVAELGRVLASVESESRDVSLDLGQVGFVDASGEALLRDALARGMRISRRSGFVAALLEQGSGGGDLTSPAPVRSDLDLVEETLGGSEEAFLALASRHDGPMREVARCLVSSERGVGEVVREAWGELLEGLSSWDRLRPLGAWAASLAAMRAHDRAARDGLADLEDPVGLEPVPLRLHAGEVRGPWRADQLESAGALDALRAAMEALPPLERAVITMRDVAACSGEEISAALGIPGRRQRELLHHARCRLRDALEEHLGAAA